MRSLIAVLFVLASCSSEPAAGGDVGLIDSGSNGSADMGLGSDFEDGDARADAGEGGLEAGEYCELTVDLFCEYYLRCDRIAAVDFADCRAQFLETCNAAFEPQYRSLADRGQLKLSASGIASCAAHLETVACERQIFDLDNACAAVWQGQATAGQPCGPGIASFVCRDGAECVLDLSLCGTCQDAGAVGDDCVDGRCVSSAVCVDDMCIARGLPGDGCDDALRCALGASCDAGVCTRAAIVRVGQACDQARRCQYQSSCLGSACVQDALLGEPCDGARCASGWCDGTICRAFVTPGDNCAEAFQCLGAACDSGECGPPVSVCI